MIIKISYLLMKFKSKNPSFVEFKMYYGNDLQSFLSFTKIVIINSKMKL
jgi:hypothetical protein